MRTLIGICFLFFILSQVGLAATQTKPQFPRVSNNELMYHSPKITAIETRLDRDFTGDGLDDVAFIAVFKEKRVLIVMAAFYDASNRGHEPIGQLKLATLPSAPASLSFQEGVFVVEDITGDTTVISVVYRYRFDKKKKRLRLISDDVMLYSTTYQHDSLKVSINRLTGKSISQGGAVNGSGYDILLPVKNKVSKEVIYMEETPNPCVALGCMSL